MVTSPNRAPAIAGRHEAIEFRESAGITGRSYAALYFGEAGVARIVDSEGTEESVTVVAGLVYPVANFGVVTGGATTVTEGTVIGLGGDA